MKKKTFRKLVTLLLTVLLCLSSIPSFALGYSAGIRDFELERKYLLETENASLDADGNLVFKAGGGAMTFDVLLPFDTVEIDFTYEALKKDVSLDIKMNDGDYSLKLEKKSTAKTVNVTELCGTNTITIKASDAIKISSVNFGKVNEMFHDSNGIHDVPFTPYEDAVVTLVVLNADVAAVKARGTILRWDMQNYWLTPKNIDGSIYVPVKKFAEAMGYYCEDYQDKSFLYLSGETHSVALQNGKGYYESDTEGKRDITLDVKYKDGYTWVPVRATSELLGFYVNYKDGYVAIGDRLRTHELFEKDDYFQQLKAELEVYIPTEKVKGKTYHVAQTKLASDANDGTEKFPFATIQKAADVAQAGDTVIIHEGTYRETVTFKNDGTVFAPITFKAADGEKVTVSALEKLSGFVPYKKGMYAAATDVDLGDGINQLFYKGEALMQGRHPNEDTLPGVVPFPDHVPAGLYATRGNMRITTFKGDKVVSDTDLNQDEINYWKGADYITLKGSGWSLAGGEVISSKKGELTVKNYDGVKGYHLGLSVASRFGNDWYYRDVHASDYGYLTNHINTVDIPGEWYMKGNVLYLIPPEGADLSNDFEIKTRMLCFDLRDRKYVVLKGINSVGGGLTMDGDTEGNVVDGGEFKWISHWTHVIDTQQYALTADEPDSALTSQKSGHSGFYIKGQYNSIINSTINYSAGAGIFSRGKYSYISNNTIANTSYSGGYPGGIQLGPDISDQTRNDKIYGGHFITWNTVYNASRAVLNNGGYTVGGTDGSAPLAMTPSEYAYNRFFNGALVTRDTGITYEYGHTAGNDRARTRMHHNYVYSIGHVDEETKHMTFGLYHDGYTVQRDTYSNVTYYEYEDLPLAERGDVWWGLEDYTVVRARNNAQLGYLENGEDDIEWSDYPGNRPFYTGCNFGEFYERSMTNYENFKNGIVSNAPVSTKENADGTETYEFENIKLGGETSTEFIFELGRIANSPEYFNVVAKAYNEKGELVKETQMTNRVPLAYSNLYIANTDFYVNETYEGLVIFPPMPEGNYKVVLELADTYSTVYRAETETIDTTYDSLFTKEMEESGVSPYYAADTKTDEEKRTESFRFEDVKIEDNVITLLNPHVTREYNKAKAVYVTTDVYDQSGSLITSNELLNKITHASNFASYEPLSATAVIPAMAGGVYDIVITFSDTYCDMIRLVASEADPLFDNLYNRPDIFQGSSWDEFIEGTDSQLIPQKTATYSLDNLKNYHWGVQGDCWNNTFIYKDREIPQEAKQLRVTYSTGQGYNNSTVNVYADSMSGKPIATFKTEDTGWAAKTFYIDLSRPLEAGTHTLIFEYVGEGRCATLWNFHFCNGTIDLDLAE